MSTELATVSGPDFSGTANRVGDAITMALSGTADYAAFDGIELLLSRTHADAKRALPSEVVVDLTNLEFMNSSCFKGFVSWITDIQDLPAADQYKVRFISNPAMHWQKRSLHSLKCFAVELITVDNA